MKRILYLSLIIGAFASAGLVSISLFFRSPKTNLDTVRIPSNQLSNTIAPTATVTPIPLPTLPPLPQMKVLSGSQTFQTFNNCGPAALSMALSHYGIQVSQQQLGQEMRPYQQARGDNDDKSVTLDELEAKAKQYGFLVYHRPAGNMELVKQFIAHDMPVVTRTWLHLGEDIGHFRVITGYDDTTQELIQDDSLQGANLRYSYNEYEELWRPFNYEFLVLVPIEKQVVSEVILGNLLNEEFAWNKSIELSDTLLASNSDDIFAVFNKSVALYHLKQYQQSIEQFELVESRLPFRMLWYQIEPLLAYFEAGNDQKVLEISDRILTRQNRAYSELYYLKGLVFQKQGNQSSANEMMSNADFFNTSGSWKANITD